MHPDLSLFQIMIQLATNTANIGGLDDTFSTTFLTRSFMEEERCECLDC